MKSRMEEMHWAKQGWSEEPYAAYEHSGNDLYAPLPVQPLGSSQTMFFLPFQFTLA